MADLKLSDLPVQTSTDTQNLNLLGYDLTKPLGQQDRTINAAQMLISAYANAPIEAGVMNGDEVLVVRNGQLVLIPADDFGITTTQTVQFDFELEDGSGCFLLEDASGFLLEEVAS